MSDHRTADAVLVDRIRSGDRAAITELYDRYADPIHAFCHAQLRSDADAADATQDTFVTAVEKLHQLREPSRLRPWLYSIARREALAGFKDRARSVPVDDMTTIQQLDDGDLGGLHERELTGLVWEAAGGLEERDQAVLDLHLRHDLGGDDLAAALEVARDHAYTLLARAKKRLGRSVGALLVARHGRRDCDSLNQLLGSWGGGLTAELRNTINLHVDRCDTCGEKRSRLTDPAALFAAIPLVAAPAALRAEVLSGLDAPASAGAAGPAAGSVPAGSADAGMTGVSAAKVAALAVAAVAAAAAGFGGVRLLADSGADEAAEPAAVVANAGPARSEEPEVVAETAPVEISADETGLAEPPATSSPGSEPDLWEGCSEAAVFASAIQPLDDAAMPAEIQTQLTAILALLTFLDAREDLPDAVRAVVDHRLPLQEAFTEAVAAQGWQLLGDEPGHDPTSGAALIAALGQSCDVGS